MNGIEERIARYIPLNELEQVLKYLFLNNIALDQIDYESKPILKIIRPEKGMTLKETLQKFRSLISHVADNSYLPTDMFIPPGRNLYIRKFPRYLADTMHYHKDALEINVVLQGEFMQRIGGNTLWMKAGDICLVAPKVTHGTRAFDDSTVTLSVMVYQDVISELLRNESPEENELLWFLKKILYGNLYHPFLICRISFGPHQDAVRKTLSRNHYGHKNAPCRGSAAYNRPEHGVDRGNGGIYRQKLFSAKI